MTKRALLIGLVRLQGALKNLPTIRLSYRRRYNMVRIFTTGPLETVLVEKGK